MNFCEYCNPDHYHVYGYCGNCGKKWHPPLNDYFDPNAKIITPEEWINYPENISELKRDPNTIEIT